MGVGPNIIHAHVWLVRIFCRIGFINDLYMIYKRLINVYDNIIKKKQIWYGSGWHAFGVAKSGACIVHACNLVWFSMAYWPYSGYQLILMDAIMRITISYIYIISRHVRKSCRISWAICATFWLRNIQKHIALKSSKITCDYTLYIWYFQISIGWQKSSGM